MTVGELKKILEDLPDDMVVSAYDVGGYQGNYNETSADIITEDRYRSGYPEPQRPYLMIWS